MIGMVTDFATSSASFAGIFSNTIAKHPASSNNFASLINLFASSSSLALSHPISPRTAPLSSRKSKSPQIPEPHLISSFIGCDKPSLFLIPISPYHSSLSSSSLFFSNMENMFLHVFDVNLGLGNY